MEHLLALLVVLVVVVVEHVVLRLYDCLFREKYTTNFAFYSIGIGVILVGACILSLYLSHVLGSVWFLGGIVFIIGNICYPLFDPYPFPFINTPPPEEE